MKRFLALALVLLMVIGLIACVPPQNDPSNTTAETSEDPAVIDAARRGA